MPKWRKQGDLNVWLGLASQSESKTKDNSPLPKSPTTLPQRAACFVTWRTLHQGTRRAEAQVIKTYWKNKPLWLSITTERRKQPYYFYKLFSLSTVQMELLPWPFKNVKEWINTLSEARLQARNWPCCNGVYFCIRRQLKPNYRQSHTRYLSALMSPGRQ